jgi:TonB family protein
MSSARTLFGFLGAFLIVGGVAAQEVRDTVGPIEKQAKPITPENPIPRRTFSVAPVYPADAQGIQASGTVSLAATIDETGRVVEIRKAREPLVLSPTTTTPTAVRIAAEGMVRVSGAVKAPTQISKVQPVYPPIALSSRVSGVVILEALIGVDGRVSDAKVLRSIPLLDQAALDAVRQWAYTPTLLNGVPVPIVMTVTVTFMLPPPPPPPPQ